MIHILLVEDQSIVRSGIKMMIEQDAALCVRAEASNGKEALEQLERHMIDLVIMDVSMPIMNGIESTQKIKAQWPTIRVLMLTTFNDEEYAMQALQYGANGFMLKTADPEHLIQSIHSCMNGGLSIHDHVTAKIMPRLLRKEAADPIQIELTKRERELVKLVGEGKTNKEIAAELYLSIGTVKNHLTQILHKLELRDRTQLAIYAVKNHLA
ncbi:response regulator transcription factor [Priestia flexa]|uniref:Response regulator transcription factor n=1 Tax=Priestia flexa TaxID=86664 RepID=A0ABU4J2L6_9BACI|nr:MULTISPECIES: response regulator transcription factor [Bacillaceae]AQX55363.1 DNA-binding response regulator [Priestia flexa]KZB91309.1 DNA-binding response regulator [Bacillus sp. VT 712]MBY6086314.1 response regulator transcription factor [Priestia flexa]MCA1201547.1 response regulator transcription factor [Priestia flexa]MCG7312941.1 response regulator transcription factor [Priestia flexa]